MRPSCCSTSVFKVFVFWAYCITFAALSVHADDARGDKSRIFGYSGDGSSLVTSIGRMESPPNRLSTQIAVWDTKTEKSVFRSPTLKNQSPWEAVLSNDGRYLAVGLSAPQPPGFSTNKWGEWMLWDVKEKRLIRKGHVAFGWVTSVKFSPDGSQFALSSDHENSHRDYDGSKIFMVETATGKTLRTYRTGWAVTYDMTFSPDGQTLALAGEIRPGQTLPFRRQPPLGIVQLWDAHAERLHRTFVQVDCDLNHLTFSPQGDRLFGSRTLQNRAMLDEDIRFFTRGDAPDPPPIPLDKETESDSKRDFVAWNLKTGESTTRQVLFETPADYVRFNNSEMKFSPDGRTYSTLLALLTPDPKYPKGSGHSESQIVVCSWKLDQIFFEDPSQPLPEKTVLLEKSWLWMEPIFSPDGLEIVAVDPQNNLHFWVRATGKLSEKTWKVTFE